jgi:NAD+ kinase
MARIGVIVHLDRVEAGLLARELAEELVAAGHEVLVPNPEAKAAGMENGVDDSEFATDLDLVVTFGGDGSILRAVELIGESGIPLLGVDFGVLGYLTEVHPADARRSIQRVLAGDHEFEDRMLVLVETRFADGQQAERHVALNEAVVERAAEANTLRLAVHIDGEFFTTYAVDGLIVATPTGSTAYAFSAGGPIVDPTHQAVLMTPVSPHMLFDRTLVLSPGTELTVTVDGHRPASLSVDGRRIAMLGDGDAIVCTASARPVRLITFGPRRFHRVLKEKFGLNDR